MGSEEEIETITDEENVRVTRFRVNKTKITIQMLRLGLATFTYF